MVNGFILRSLFQIENFDSVIFVDDQIKNCDHVVEAFEGLLLDTIVYRYSEEDAEVRRFEKTGKFKAHADWLKLRKTLNEIF